NQPANFTRVHVALLRHARSLKLGCGRGNVWVKARTRTGHQIDGRWLRRLLGAKLLYGSVHPINQRIVPAPAEAPPVRRRIVSGSRSTSPCAKIPTPGE